MITEETVIITGAGASRPYGYPTGYELKNIICKNLTNTFPFHETISISYSTYEEGKQRIISRSQDFIKAFRQSNVDSIDKYLSLNPSFVEIGKICILLTIFKAEESPGYWIKNNPPKIFEVEDDWLSYLYNVLISGPKGPISYDKLSENKVTFITFNYDRLLEHYLFNSYRFTYNEVENSSLLAEFRKINFMHVYGQISLLPWQLENGKLNGKLDYKERFELRDLWDKVDNIVTIYEERQKSNFEKIREVLNKAKRIIFLGFGYAPENLDILKINDLVYTYPWIYGTGLCLTPNEIRKKKSSLAMYNKNSLWMNEEKTIIEDCNCLSLLRNYL